MRFFRPALSPVTLNNSIAFNPASAYVKSILISGDLAKLQVVCAPSSTKNRKTMIRNALESELKQFPFPISCRSTGNSFHIDGLKDIRLTSEDTCKRLLEEDPSFFRKLDEYIDACGEDEECINPDIVTTSQLGFNYFCLQDMRQRGIQHAVEFPLKGMQRAGFLRQPDLNEIIEQVWLRTSQIRKQHQHQQQSIKPPEPEFVPYVFSK